MTRSDEWDNQEKKLDEYMDIMANPSLAKNLDKAREIYRDHHPTHVNFECAVSEDKIEYIKCGQCSWSWGKRWWQFWK